MLIRTISALISIAFLAAPVWAQTTTPATKIKFEVTVAPQLGQKTFAGRLFVTMVENKENNLSDLSGFLLDQFPISQAYTAAIEVKNLIPGKKFDFNPDQLTYPKPFSQANDGNYFIQAFLDTNHTIAYGSFDGVWLSDIVEVKNLKNNTKPIELIINQPLSQKPELKDTENIKFVTMKSQLLSQFWGRSIEMHAEVVLPPGYGSEKTTYPTVYLIHGFGENYWNLSENSGATLVKEMLAGKTPKMIYVLLDAAFPTGHTVFADSVNNGPWGQALTAEFIPFLEKRFPMDAVPRGRLLTGHSSGGWASLWLMVNYPDVFGATWSTAPDPVDFRRFISVDLANDNIYHDSAGNEYNMLRASDNLPENSFSIRQYAQIENILGDYGGQFSSLEYVFSPKADDGRPMPLFDRETGQIDPFVAQFWQKYDISKLLRDNWLQLGPQLQGKINIFVGDKDSFHLEEAVLLLQDELKKLGSDAYFEIVPGRDHLNLRDEAFETKIAQQMYQFARRAH